MQNTKMLFLPSVTGILGVFSMIFVSLLLLLRLWRRNGEKVNKILPGPFSLPIIGASYIMNRYKKPWDAFSYLRKKYGDIYQMRLGSRNCVIVSSLSAIREVLVSKSEDFANRPDFLRFHAIFRGDRNLSIALCDWSKKQKFRRSLAFPFMHPRTADLGSTRMSHYINNELRFLLSQLSEFNNRPIKPRKILLIATANIFYQFLCSKRFAVDDTDFLNVVETYDVVFHELFQGFAIDFMPWLRLANTGKLKRLQQLAESVGKMTAAIFKEREIERKNRIRPLDGAPDLVDLFLEQCSAPVPVLSREEAEVIVEDLIGGHSVLSNLWLWGLQFLAAHPNVAKKIRQETLTVTSGCRQTTLVDRPLMPYTEATVMELLRVISSPIIPHVATRNTTIQGYSVAKGCMIMFNTYDINMNKDNWQDPETFKPERFLNSNNKIQKPDHFFPFSVGKRTCIGDGLVRGVLLLGFSTLLQHFDISLPDHVDPVDIKTVCGMVVPQNEVELCFRSLKTNYD